MYFPDFDRNDGRILVPIRGRGYLVTNSAQVEFVTENQRERFPLAASELYSVFNPLMPDGYGLCFLIEAHGYLVLVAGAVYSFLEIAPFQQFDFRPSDTKTLPFWSKAPEVTVNYTTYQQDTFDDGTGKTYSVHICDFTDNTEQHWKFPMGVQYPQIGDTKRTMIARGGFAFS